MKLDLSIHWHEMHHGPRVSFVDVGLDRYVTLSGRAGSVTVRTLESDGSIKAAEEYRRRPEVRDFMSVEQARELRDELNRVLAEADSQLREVA